MSCIDVWRRDHSLCDGTHLFSLAVVVAPIFSSFIATAFSMLRSDYVTRQCHPCGGRWRWERSLRAQNTWRRSRLHRSCRSWCRHWHRFWLSNPLGVSQSFPFEAALWLRYLRLCSLRGDGTLCPHGGFLYPFLTSTYLITTVFTIQTSFTASPWL